MTLKFRFIVLLLAVPVLSFPLSAETLAFVGGAVIQSPGARVIEPGVIVVDNGRFIAVGAKDQVDIPAVAKRIDTTGRYVVAGFWNSHVHYLTSSALPGWRDTENLQRFLTNTFLRWGFVNTVDTGSDLNVTFRIRERIGNGDVTGPGIMTMGGTFVPKGGSPFYIQPITLPEFTDEAQAGRLTAETLDLGADGIKLFTGSWADKETVVVMEQAHVAAATGVAHERGALVFAHPSDSEGAAVAIHGGVDVLAHTFPSQIKGPWNKSLIGDMVKRNVALIPTIKLFRDELEKLGLPPEVVDIVQGAAIEQTAAAHKAGVTILFGTDVGYLQDANPTDEYRAMGAAGLDYNAILASLTTSPAQKYGVGGKQGKIEVGFMADLVVLGTDPRDSITALADVAMTVRNGQVVFER